MLLLSKYFLLYCEITKGHPYLNICILHSSFPDPIIQPAAIKPLFGNEFVALAIRLRLILLTLHSNIYVSFRESKLKSFYQIIQLFAINIFYFVYDLVRQCSNGREASVNFAIKQKLTKA